MLKWWVETPRIAYLTLIWAAVILVLSALPGRDLPKVDLLHVDKLAHVVVYLILFMLLVFWMRAKSTHTIYLKAFIAVSLYGILMEFMQDTFFSERFFDWADAIANSTGALLGIVIFKVFG